MEYRPSLHPCVIDIGKCVFGSPSTKVANFTFYFCTFLYIILILSAQSAVAIEYTECISAED